MATIQQIQNFLRQKRAQGRLSPQEIQQAYHGYFGAESDASMERERIEQQERRDTEAKRQAQWRELQYAKQERDARHAAELKGRLQLAKIAVPDLFQTGGGGGGAQQSTIGSYSPAVDSLGYSGSGFSETGAMDAAEAAARGSIDWSGGKSLFGQDSVASNLAEATIKGAVLGQAPVAAAMSLTNEAIEWGGNILGQIFGARPGDMDMSTIPAATGTQAATQAVTQAADVAAAGINDSYFDFGGFGSDGSGDGIGGTDAESFGAGGGTSAGFGGTGLGGY